MTIGYAMCGSFCTLDTAIDRLEELGCLGYEILPIMSEVCYTSDTRFGTARSKIERIEKICNREIIHTITAAEPIGPKKLLDVLIISPCTGNTMAKMALGITDSSVTMAAKSHMRNRRPLIIAPATNDALSTSLKNMGYLLERKNVYFVPFGQDDPAKKPTSMIADFSRLDETLKLAMAGKQIQPILL